MSLPQLFTGRPLTKYLESHGGEMLRRADTLPRSAWEPDHPLQPRLSDHAVAEIFLRDIAIVIPIVEWTKLHYAAEESTVPVREPGSITLQQVQGVRLTASVPYVGDKNLLTSRPTEHGTGRSSHSVTVQPHGNEHGQIVCTFEGRRVRIADVQVDLETLGLCIVEHLDYARNDLARYRENIIPRLLDVLARRRRFHDALDDLESRLGL